MLKALVALGFLVANLYVYHGFARAELFPPREEFARFPLQLGAWSCPHRDFMDAATLENLGFCKPGEGGDFVSNGRIGLGGELPVNPDGGGLSSNHPGMPIVGKISARLNHSKSCSSSGVPRKNQT